MSTEPLAPGHHWATPQKSMGAASELKGAAHLLAQGYDVYRSVAPHAGVDLVAVKGGLYAGVEVKTAGKPRLPGHAPPFGWPVNDEWDLLLIVGPDVVFQFERGTSRAEATAQIRQHFGLAVSEAQVTHQQRVGELLVQTPGQEWTARTVALSLGMTAVAARSALVALHDAGVAERKKPGVYEKAKN